MRQWIPWAAMAAALLASSCSFLNVTYGNGTIVTESRAVGAFTTVSVEGSGTLRVHRGPRNVEVTADSNILPLILTTVSGTDLRIGGKPFTGLVGTADFVYDVTLPDLEAVRLSGSCVGRLDAFEGASFRGVLEGSGSLEADLGYGSVTLQSMGSGGFHAALETGRLSYTGEGSAAAVFHGTATEASISILGSGGVDAEGLSTGKADVSVYGSGSIGIRAAGSLSVTLCGLGNLTYWGSPALTQLVTGLGRIARAGD